WMTPSRATSTASSARASSSTVAIRPPWNRLDPGGNRPKRAALPRRIGKRAPRGVGRSNNDALDARSGSGDWAGGVQQPWAQPHLSRDGSDRAALDRAADQPPG